MKVEDFISLLSKGGVGAYFGVPDSLLKPLCSYLSSGMAGIRHVTAANEGGAMGMATGYYLATGTLPVVYMQNSGLGNVVNPLLSLCDEKVYDIPMLLVIGWRGEPGCNDEPQHVTQGRLTLPMLECMGIPYSVLSPDDSAPGQIVEEAVSRARSGLSALVIRKGAIEGVKTQLLDSQKAPLAREEAIDMVLGSLPDTAAVVSTTGMISREVFEIREGESAGHGRDFLTVGSMGHASQIALGISIAQPGRAVYCLDGDGAVLMHMGAMAINAQVAPGTFVHVVLNNGAHDSVGGQPTVALQVDLPAIAKACGYKRVESVENATQLANALESLHAESGTAFLEIKVKRGARADLGRPTTTPAENKRAFMSFLAQ